MLRTTKLYKISVSMYLEAIDEDRALAMAELNCFTSTEAIRSANPDWVTDSTSIMRSEQVVEQVAKAPKSSYDKELLTRILGDASAIRLLNEVVDTSHR